MLGAFLNHRGRYAPLNFRDEVPVKLKNTQGTSKPAFLFRETLCLSNQPTHSFPQDAVKILNINRFHIMPVKITINHSDILPNKPPISIPNFHQLTITQLFNFEEAWKNIRVIVVSISEHLDSFASPNLS